MPTTAKGSYNTCLWTGYAAFICDDPSINTSLLKHSSTSNVNVPGMPDDLCDQINVDQVSVGIRFVAEGIRKYYDESVVLHFDVSNIPPKIDTNKYPNMRPVVEHTKNSTRNVHPCKLLKRDIASNAGLISVLLDICDTYGITDGSCTEYLTLNVDSNIYWRILKV